jgi:hypothetical protein
MFRPEASMARGITAGWTWQSFIFDPVFCLRKFDAKVILSG